MIIIIGQWLSNASVSGNFSILKDPKELLFMGITHITVLEMKI